MFLRSFDNLATHTTRIIPRIFGQFVQNPAMKQALILNAWKRVDLSRERVRDTPEKAEIDPARCVSACRRDDLKPRGLRTERQIRRCFCTLS